MNRITKALLIGTAISVVGLALSIGISVGVNKLLDHYGTGGTIIGVLFVAMVVTFSTIAYIELPKEKKPE